MQSAQVVEVIDVIMLVVLDDDDYPLDAIPLDHARDLGDLDQLDAKLWTAGWRRAAEWSAMLNSAAFEAPSQHDVATASVGVVAPVERITDSTTKPEES